jgi:hypothetical protein
METIIKVNPSELNKSLLDKIKKFIGTGGDAEITISINDSSVTGTLRNESCEQYFARLDKSLENIEKGNVVRFTADEFKTFSSKLLNQQ